MFSSKLHEASTCYAQVCILSHASRCLLAFAALTFGGFAK